ncbi:sulfatase-like hydrolase/transferase [Plantactinospora siamensis]|uniref:Sulfatase-like hydrolase/transferase n=1 Tax=Plantactinospora siamensis TaxID=555372 RepID=A0ABV6P6V2_9ACTN
MSKVMRSHPDPTADAGGPEPAATDAGAAAYAGPTGTDPQPEAGTDPARPGAGTDPARPGADTDRARPGAGANPQPGTDPEPAAGAEPARPGAEPEPAGADRADRTPAGPVRDEEAAGGGTGTRSLVRRVLATTLTVLSCLVVLFALLAPNRLDRMGPGSFVRIPGEALVGAALVLLLPPRLRRIATVVIGAGLGVLTILKIADMGFYLVMARPSNPAVDWPFLGAGVGYLRDSMGRGASIAAVVAAIVAVFAVLVLLVLAVRRVTGVLVAHRTPTMRVVTGLGVVWIACSLIGVQIVPGVPLAADSAAHLAYAHTRQVDAGLRDRQLFAAVTGNDPFKDTPGSQLLTGLRGKDVMVTFIESYGRAAVEDPQMSAVVNPVLDEGTRQLHAAGYDARSAFLGSPTYGGGSWLAHATLMSGVWANNQQRYSTLVNSTRLTLNGAFRRAGWRTALVMPALEGRWPQARFFASDHMYGAAELDYHGPKFGFSPMPDQFTLGAMQKAERGPGHSPVMVETVLTSSHSPWTPCPQLIDWNALGDGSIFTPMAAGASTAESLKRRSAQTRADYAKTIAYSLSSLISYVKTYGDRNLVLVFLGDHQAAPEVSGNEASHDVPVTIVAKDPAVLDRITGWGWQPGMHPSPQAPVWPMDAFRDRFLTSFQR